MEYLKLQKLDIDYDEFSKFINIMNDSLVSNSGQINKTIDFNSMVLLSLKSKKWFIETDEFDQKERLLLNFGHTFGHAIETFQQYKGLLHVFQLDLEWQWQ